MMDQVLGVVILESGQLIGLLSKIGRMPILCVRAYVTTVLYQQGQNYYVYVLTKPNWGIIMVQVITGPALPSSTTPIMSGSQTAIPPTNIPTLLIRCVAFAGKKFGIG